EELRHIARHHPSVSPDAILRMGTLAGAEALGIAGQFGSITPGKSATFAVVPVPGGAEPPLEAVLHSTANVARLYRQLLICVSKIACAPRASSCSMTLITSPRRTMTRTAHQAGSSRALTVGLLKPGVIFSASASFVRGMLYSRSDQLRAMTTPSRRRTTRSASSASRRALF